MHVTINTNKSQAYVIFIILQYRYSSCDENPNNDNDKSWRLERFHKQFFSQNINEMV